MVYRRYPSLHRCDVRLRPHGRTGHRHRCHDRRLAPGYSRIAELGRVLN